MTFLEQCRHEFESLTGSGSKEFNSHFQFVDTAARSTNQVETFCVFYPARSLVFCAEPDTLGGASYNLFSTKRYSVFSDAKLISNGAISPEGKHGDSRMTSNVATSLAMTLAQTALNALCNRTTAVERL